MEPKRKQGVCHSSNPIMQQSPNNVMRTSGNDFVGASRQACDFSTFKGHESSSSSSARSTFKDLSSPQHQRQQMHGDHGAKESPPGGNTFQVVPLDDTPHFDSQHEHHYNHRLPPIEPINFKSMQQQQTKPAVAQPREPFKFAGYLGTIFSSVLCSFSVLCLKLLPVEDSIQEKAKACMIRGLFLVFFCAITIAYQGHSFLVAKGEYMINFARAVLGAVNIIMIYVAIKFITMGECSALVYSSPVWTCILGSLILKEPLPVSLLLALPTSIIGIILLAHPDLLVDTRSEVVPSLELHLNHSLVTSANDALARTINETIMPLNMVGSGGGGGGGNDELLDEIPSEIVSEETQMYFQHRLPGIILALVGSVILSVVIIILKFRKRTSIATCSFYLGVAMVAVSIIVQVTLGFGAMPTTRLEWSLHVCIGVFSYLTQCMFQWSLQYVPAGSYSVVRSLDIVLGFILGAIFLNDNILWTSVVGSLLIVIVVAILMLNEYIEMAFRWMGCCCGRSGTSSSSAPKT